MAWNIETILTVFVGLTAFSVLLQACILFAIFISLRQSAKAVIEATGDLKATILPMVHTTRELVERITPQVATVTQGLAGFTELVQRESADAQMNVGEMLARLNRQSARLDQMLTAGLDSLERTGSALEASIAAPVRQVNGILAAAKAMLATYRSAGSGSRADRKPV